MHTNFDQVLKDFGVCEGDYSVTINKSLKGFQGVYHTLQVRNEGKWETWFIKSVPTGSSIVNDFYESYGIFTKEAQVYRRLFPAMMQFCDRNLWAECRSIKEGQYLVLRDLTDLGWRMTSFIDWDHAKTAAVALAEFHWSSLAAWDKVKAIELQETMFSDDKGKPGRKMWDSFCQLALEIVKRYLPGQRADGIRFQLRRVVSVVKPSKKYRNCVNHGDLWINNMFFKYANDVPVRACFVDFQSSRFAPPALDLAIFSRICGTENTEELANVYYEKLNELQKRSKKTVLSEIEFKESLDFYGPPATAISALYAVLTQLPAAYLTRVLVSHESIIFFALGEDYSPVWEALEDDNNYRKSVLRALQNISR